MVCRRFPHTRGGGPCSAAGASGISRVFPTRVGVDRTKAACSFTARCFPPHAWGWTVLCNHGHIFQVVFPTRVGVDRIPGRTRKAHWPFSPHAWGWTGSRHTGQTITWCFPHTRGGGPLDDVHRPSPNSFSPHAWGWTVYQADYKPSTRVFPTRVGVDRGCGGIDCGHHRFPHTRGGGPPRWAFGNARDWFSPHAWGWTAQMFGAA